MTTKVTIENGTDSNGDVVLKGFNTTSGKFEKVLLPGENHEVWITDHSVLIVTETWPSKKPKDSIGSHEG